MAKGETIFGGTDDDTLQGQDGADVVNGGYGDDRLDGGAGNDVLDGGRGSDLLMGGDGNDTLVSGSDAGEPVIAQDYDPNAGRNNEIDPATGRLYPNQPFVADDILVGGAGADTFMFTPQLNAKEDILQKHTDDNGVIDWSMTGVAGENNNAHDHWVDSIGTDVIADYDKTEGDRILIHGHTVDPDDITYADVDGDGDEESIIALRSNQGGNGGAHDGDYLGQIIVHGDRVEEGDIQTAAGVNYGVIDTIDQLAEAIAPTGTPDSDIESTVTENPFAGDVTTRNPGENVGNDFVEEIYDRPTIVAVDDVITGTDGADTLIGDPMVAPQASLDAPISYWSLSDATNGTFSDATGVSEARLYSDFNGLARLETDVPMIDGPNGSPAVLFGDGEQTFAYVANDEAYQVLNGTISAWINPTDLGGTIISKDARGPDGGGHFHVRVEDDGRLYVRVADGDSANDGYNNEWRSEQPLITEGQWQNVSLSFGAAGVAVYVDGVQIGDDQFETVRGDTPMSELVNGYAIGNEQPFILGANSYLVDADSAATAQDIGINQSLVDFFEGGIADVGFWGGSTPGEALSAEQIAELVANGPGDLSNASAPTPPPIPVGNDTIFGEGGDDIIDGGAGNDQLDGGAGNDDVQGGYGNDTVAGGAGNDIIDGGHGEDTLSGGDGDDRLISRADDREPVIAQDFDASDDPNGDIDPDARMLYPSQANMPSDDVLTGGAGADEFFFQTLINAKEEIINKHVNDDGTIRWHGVAGENNDVHDHWVDGIGSDTITDFNQDEGDTIVIDGHTTEVSSVDVLDVDGDGDMDTVLQLRSNQGAGGGAHNLDLLGTITVLDNELTENDFTTNAGSHAGIVETISEYQEAITPLGLSGPPSEPPPLEQPPSEQPPEVEPPIAEAPPSGSPPTNELPPMEPPVEEVPPVPELPPEAIPPVPPGSESPPSDMSMLEELLTPTDDNPLSDTTTVGDDLLIGTATSDDMTGSWGDDRLAGAAGDDEMMGGHGDDLLAGQEGDDFLAGDFGDDILVGGTGQDELRGNRGEDVLVGGMDDDVLDGGAGDDVLYGGAGEDAMDGGRGHDTVVLDGAIGDYTVTTIDDGLIVTNAAGQSDLLVDIEHVHFNGSGESYAIEDGALVATDHADEIEDLLEGDLLAELLSVSIGDEPGMTVDQQLAEMGELEAALPPAVVPVEQQPGTQSSGTTFATVADLNLGIDVPGEDDLRVA